MLEKSLVYVFRVKQAKDAWTSQPKFVSRSESCFSFLQTLQRFEPRTAGFSLRYAEPQKSTISWPSGHLNNRGRCTLSPSGEKPARYEMEAAENLLMVWAFSSKYVKNFRWKTKKCQTDWKLSKVSRKKLLKDESSGPRNSEMKYNGEKKFWPEKNRKSWKKLKIVNFFCFSSFCSKRFVHFLSLRTCSVLSSC